MTKVGRAIWEDAYNSGIVQGMEEGKKQIAENMLKKGLSVDEVSDSTGLPESVILEISKSIPLRL